MFGLTPAHLLIILVIALVVIGPGKLPEVGAALGKSIREFQKASGGITDSLTGVTKPMPQQPTPQQPPAQSYYAAQPGQPTYAAPAQYAPPQYAPAAQPPQYAPQQLPQYGAPEYGAPIAQQAPQYGAPVDAPQPGIADVATPGMNAPATPTPEQPVG